MRAIGVVVLAIAFAAPAAATAGQVTIPEPSTLALLGAAAAGVVAVFRIRRDR